MAVFYFVRVVVVGCSALASAAVTTAKEHVMLELGEFGQCKCDGLVEARGNAEAGLRCQGGGLKLQF